ncbi:hypothetical protein [Peribacillus sp. JNUCC41]|uniref:hypothetical protein n=1 Tax=Peribacillus sp. JNUCC41 TaxID=2778370 RepID=UPI00177C8588|nr:hypothetical protein [Brevibacillus sp. JNUCC-41]QOS90237.1 hypothetical protein JNUCC41_00135 [Brevibacillus sp. JNUCC-41]
MRFVGIDPSTKTGFVAINQGSIVLKDKELKGISSEDPKRMSTLIDEVMAHVRMDDIICIEGFPYETQRAMFAGGLHWGIRNALYKRGITYYEAAPNAVKKFVNVTGWVGEVGHKKRLTGPEKKKVVMKAVEEHFGFVHKSDNVVDAYILAEIAKDIWTVENGKECSINSGFLPSYQAEVIDTILNPVEKPKKKRKKKVAKV